MELLDEATVADALADPVTVDGETRTRWYGLHWEIYRQAASGSELPVFGHRGATGTLGLAVPERNAVVVFLTNSSETDVVEEVIGLSLDLLSE